MTLAMNGIRAVSIRRMTNWAGPWSADVELDLGELPSLPIGPATLTIGALRLSGTADPAQSGRFGFLARARVVAGAGGWEKPIPGKHHKNDGGVLTTTVFRTAASEVGETIVELVPARFGTDFIRHEGAAAARVLDGFDWRVGADGITTIGARVPTPAPTGVRVLEWDARTRVAVIAADEVLVEPGMVLTDSRFGTAMIRDVEQTWSDAGARAIAHTVAPDAAPKPAAGGEVLALLGTIAADACKDLPTFRYEVIAQALDGRFMLRTLNDEKTPDLKLIALAPAVPGMSVKVPPGTIVHVLFVRGDKRPIPVVVRFEMGTTPISITVNTLHMHVGSELAPTVGPVAMAVPVAAQLAAVGAAAVALPTAVSTASAAQMSAIKTAIDALCGVVAALPGGIGAGAAGVGTAFDSAMGTATSAAAAALGPPTAALATATAATGPLIPSTRLFSE